MFNLWMECVWDCVWVISFGCFLWYCFFDDCLFQVVVVLVYIMVFVLVLLVIVVFGVFLVFFVFDCWSDQFSDYVFFNFVFNVVCVVEGYLWQFLVSVGQFIVVGFIVLVVLLLIMFNSVEEIFNQIWWVGLIWFKLICFLVYWIVLILGVMFVVVLLVVLVRVFVLLLFGIQEGCWLVELVLWLVLILIEFVCIMLMFWVVLYYIVKWWYVIFGVILVVVILELVKWGIGVYLGSFQFYQKLYGMVVFVLILLLWIYLCWVVVLLGVLLVFLMVVFCYQLVELCLLQGYEFYGLLCLFGCFQYVWVKGKGLVDDEILWLELMLIDLLLQDLICNLQEIDLLCCDECGEWLLLCDLDQVSLVDFYECIQLCILVVEQYLLYCDDSLGCVVLVVLDDL